MESLKQYFDQLLARNSYRGWHVVQADKVSHDAIAKALHGIIEMSIEGQFLATDNNLSKLNKEYMGRGESHLTIRKQVLVNLSTLNLIHREGEGQDLIVTLTSRAEEYLNYENKEFYMDSFLEQFEIKIPTELKPFSIILKIISDQRLVGTISLYEFQYFVSQIFADNQIEEIIDFLLSYRHLSDESKIKIEGYIKGKCEIITKSAIAQSLTKDSKRDFGNWQNNARHSLELFSLGSQVKLIDDQLHLLLGSDELKRKIFENLALIDQKVKVHKQVVHFRDKKVMDDLKKLYSYYCQFCGYNYIRIPTREGFYVEAAHIIPVSEQGQREENLNSPDNIIISCANHHKMVDKHYPEFKKEIVEFSDGRLGLETTDKSTRLFLTLNEHIKQVIWGTDRFK